MEERRKWKRYAVAYPIEGERDASSAKLVDASKGGIAFTSDMEVCVDERVNLRVFLKHKMFNIKSVIVYANRLQNGLYSIGAKFIEVPEEFDVTFEKEIEEMIQFWRECKLYQHKDISFQKASLEYLRNTPPSKVE